MRGINGYYSVSTAWEVLLVKVVTCILPFTSVGFSWIGHNSSIVCMYLIQYWLHTEMSVHVLLVNHVPALLGHKCTKAAVVHL